MVVQGHVSVHALNAGYLTLPERFFVVPLEDQEAKKTVPSLSFLIQHQSPSTSKLTRIVFDLGIRRDISRYPPLIQKHALTRQPLSGLPDVVASLAKGNLKPEDVDFIVLSHVHWDHIGMPSDFQTSQFVIGNGSSELLSGRCKPQCGSHSHFEADLLPQRRTFVLSDPGRDLTPPPSDEESNSVDFQDETKREYARANIFRKPWMPKGIFPLTMDVFGDGSLYIVSAPGHITGHINLLCRKADGKYVYLAGDSYHDSRLLTREKSIATWVDAEHPGQICCIHTDIPAAKQTLELIKTAASAKSSLGEVEVIFAHDSSWEREAHVKGKFFPDALYTSISGS